MVVNDGTPILRKGFQLGSVVDWKSDVYEQGYVSSTGNTCFRIVEIFRYMSDPNLQEVNRRMKNSNPELFEDCEFQKDMEYAYDLLLADKKHLMKVAVHCVNNKVIDMGKVDVNTVIKLEYCHPIFNEVKVDATAPVLFVLKFSIVGDLSSDVPQGLKFPSLKEFPKHLQFESIEELLQPLMGCRSRYLALYNDDDFPHHESSDFILRQFKGKGVWKKETLKLKFEDLKRKSAVSLTSALDNYKPQHVNPFYCIIVRKSKIVYYGKPDVDGKRDPFQMYLTVSDGQTRASLVFWTSAVPKFFRSLGVGDTILVCDYRVKKKYDPSPDINSEYEVTVNPSHPTGNIYILDDEDRKKLKVPYFPFTFALCPQSELGNVKDGSLVTVFGLAVFVGRLQRERKLDSLNNPRRRTFSSVIWVVLKDHTSNCLTFVKVFSCSQPQMYSLYAGVPVVITSVKACSLFENSTRNRHPYFVSTGDSTITTGDESSVWSTESSNAELAALRTKPFRQLYYFNREYGALLSQRHTFFENGYFSYPPLDKHRWKNADLVTLSSFSDIYEDLCIYESRTVFVQGYVVSFEFNGLERKISGAKYSKKIPINTRLAENAKVLETVSSETLYSTPIVNGEDAPDKIKRKPCGYITIVGLNRDIAVRTNLVPNHIYRDVSGQGATKINNFIMSSDNMKECVTEMLEDRLPFLNFRESNGHFSEEMLQAQLEHQRVLFALDLFKPQCHSVEIVLKEAYTPS
eukprot:Nk52_evm47s222 gene=Nk52_evmTU47s222